MSELYVNDKPVITGRITLHRRGPWRAQLVIDSNETLESPVTIGRDEGDILFIGAVVSAEVRSDRVEAELVGGGGRLQYALPSKAYNNVTVAIVLQDLATEAGEQLSAGISTDLLSTQLAYYIRTEARASQQLDALADLLGVQWRVLTDGTLWLGNDAWNTVTIEHDLLADSAARSSAEIATDELSIDLVPGVTFNGKHVSFVEHCIDPDRMRTKLLYERSDAAAMDAAKGPLTRLIEGVTWQSAYARMYPGRVVLQHANGSIDVILDDDTMPGLSQVKILAPYPGSTVKVAAGTRVEVGFVAADPRLPVAMIWESGTTQATELALNAGTIKLNGGGANVIRAGDSVNASADMALWFTAIQTATGVAPPTGAIGTTTGGNATVKA